MSALDVAHDILTGERATVYVVMGSTGEHSDRCEWAVSAHVRKADADERLARLEEWCRANGVHGEQTKRGVLVDYDTWKKLRCPLDPGFQCDYTGTDYYVVEVPYGGGA